MCKPTNNEETSRTCTACEVGDITREGWCDICGAVDAGPEPDFDKISDGMGDFEPATGYEADDDNALYWEQRAEG